VGKATNIRRAATAIFLALGATPAVADGLPQPACWFYVYHWSWTDTTGGVGDFHTYPVTGYGTGMMVTDGGEPSRGQKAAAEVRAAAGLPHIAGLPPSMAVLTQVTPVACPRDWPRIPGVPANLLDHPRY